MITFDPINFKNLARSASKHRNYHDINIKICTDSVPFFTVYTLMHDSCTL